MESYPKIRTFSEKFSPAHKKDECRPLKRHTPECRKSVRVSTPIGGNLEGENRRKQYEMTARQAPVLPNAYRGIPKRRRFADPACKKGDPMKTGSRLWVGFLSTL